MFFRRSTNGVPLARSTPFRILAATLLAACSSGATDPKGAALVALTSPQSSLVRDETVQLTAQVKDARGELLPNESVTYTSASPSVATVTGDGVVTGVGVGKTSVSARAGSAVAQVAIIVAEGGVVGPAGGTVIGFGGAIRLTFPSGAVGPGTAIRLAAVANPLLDPTAVRGSLYSISPDGTQFAAPVSVVVQFDPSNGPVGASVSDLHVRRFDGAKWVASANGSVDVGLNRASADLTTTGTISVGWVAPDAPCVTPETRQFDFWVGEWSVSVGGQSTAQSDITLAPGGCADF